MKILDNGIAVIEGDTHISRWVQEHRRLDHDVHILGIILPHLEEGDWVVDAGAFIGDHTIAYLKAVGPEGKVFAFEPNPAAYSCLCHNCPQAVAFNAGLSDKERMVDYQFDVNAGASRVGSGSGSFHLSTLDSLNLRRCDFFKLDVEGCEYEALVGAHQTIARFKPVLWVEVNESALAARKKTPADLHWLIEKEFAYDVTCYPEERGPQYDILCIPSQT